MPPRSGATAGPALRSLRRQPWLDSVVPRDGGPSSLSADHLQPCLRLCLREPLAVGSKREGLAVGQSNSSQLFEPILANQAARYWNCFENHVGMRWLVDLPSQEVTDPRLVLAKLQGVGL